MSDDGRSLWRKLLDWAGELLAWMSDLFGEGE